MKSSTTPSMSTPKGLINSIPKLNAEEKERLVPIEGQYGLTY